MQLSSIGGVKQVVAASQLTGDIPSYRVSAEHPDTDEGKRRDRMNLSIFKPALLTATKKPAIMFIVSLVFFLVFGNFSSICAQVRIDPSHPQERSIQKDIFLLKDPEHRLSIQEVIQAPYSNKFKANLDQKKGYGYSDAAYWIRFTLYKHQDNKQKWYLKHAYPHLDQLEFYEPNKNGTYTITRVGDTMPFSERPVKNRFFLFPIHPAEAGTTYYLRISSNGAVNFPLSIIDHETVLGQDRSRQITEGLFFGALLIMVTYHLLFFVFVRERNYLYYSMHVLFLFLYQVTVSGFGFEHLWPNSPGLNNSIDIFSSCALFFFGGLFTIGFIQTKQHMPRIHMILMGNTALLGILSLLVYIVPRHYILNLTNMIAFIQILLLMIVAVIGCTKGLRQAYIFLLAWIIALTGGLLLAPSLPNLPPNENSLFTDFNSRTGSW